MSTLELQPLAPWQQRVYAQAAAALDSGRLGHALLLCGPPRLGKRAVAERLARRLLCEARGADGEACGRCRGCLLFANRHQRDPLEVRPGGAPAHPFGHAGHPDLMLVGHEVNDKTGKPRTEIVIEQIRRLSEKLALTPQYGGAQIAILDPAEAINHAACNALLKTLEEPQDGRYLWLVSAQPARLPATIRSRCQRVDLPEPGMAAALDWLVAQGLPATQASAALAASQGNPGLALAWCGDASLPLLESCAQDLAALARGRKGALELAEQWAADRPAQRLWFAAVLARDEARRRAAEPSLSLTARAEIPKLAAWFGRANRARGLLVTSLRIDLLLLDLLRDWPRRDAIPD